MSNSKTKKELVDELAIAKKRIAELEERIAQSEKSEVKHLESEELFHLLLKYTPIYIFFKNEKIQAISLSDNYADLLGRPVEEILWKDMEELFPPDLAKSMIEDDKKVLGSPVPIEVQEKLGERYFSTIKFPVKRHDGSNLIAGFTIDITGQKSLELQLRENEESLSTLINSTPDIICFKDGKGRWLKANQADLELFCLTDIDYFGKTDSELADYTDKLYREAFLYCEVTDEEAWKAGVTSRKEESIPTISGEIKVYDVIKVPVFYDDGSRKGLVVFGRDITAKKKAEDEIVKSEKLYRTLIESADDGILLLDKDFNRLIANASYYKIFGYDPEDDPDLTGFRFVHPDDVECTRIKMAEILEKGGSDVDFRIVRDNGSVVDVSSKSVAIYDEKGNPEKILSILRDVTESKNKERELLKLNATKDIFFNIIAHDLRSPFHGYLGLTEAILSDLYDLSITDLSRMMSQLHSSAGNLYKLLNNLLDWSRLQQGTFEIRNQKILFQSTLDEILNLFEQNLLQKKITLTKEIENGLYFNTDGNMLQTILRNLIGNAIKFTRKEGLIRISASGRNNGKVHISIKDNGVGMTEATMKKLFKIEEKFREKGTDGEEGSGLGLLICKDMVERLGGQIWIESELSKGSTFHFTLPIEVV